MADEAVRYETAQAASEADIEAVDAGLHRYNLAAADLGAVKPLFCFARDASGRLVGGLRARSWGTAFEIQQVWVDEGHRRRGIASQLLQRIERAARERGGTVIYLDTFSFQAPELYRRNGYDVAWQVAGFPDGIVKCVMHKRLDGAAKLR